MTDSRYRLPKKCHLCGETTIARLYKEGRAFIVFPIRVVYLLEQKSVDADLDDNAKAKRPTVRIMFVAPKKRFRHAVDRNHYRRLMREAYRLNQHPLTRVLDEHNATMDISFVVVHNEMPSYGQVEKCVQKILGKLISAVDTSCQSTLNSQHHVD